MNKHKSSLENSFTSSVSSTTQPQRRPPLTLKFNEINITPQKEQLNFDKNEKKSDQKQKLPLQQINQQVLNSNKKSGRKQQIIETDLVIQEFEKLKLRTLQRIQKNQITQQGSDIKTLRDQIYEQIYLLIADNLKQTKAVDSKKLGYECTCQKAPSFNLNDSSLCISNFSSVVPGDDPLQISTIFENKEEEQQKEIDKLKEENTFLARQKELEFILSQNLIQQMKKQSLTSNLDYQFQLQQQDCILKQISDNITQKNKPYNEYIEELFEKNTPVNTDDYQSVKHYRQTKMNNDENIIQKPSQNITDQLSMQIQSKGNLSSSNSSPNSINVKDKQAQYGNNTEIFMDETQSEINEIAQGIIYGLINLEKSLGSFHPQAKSIKELIQKSQRSEKLVQEVHQAWKQQIAQLQKQLGDCTISTWNTRFSSNSNPGEREYSSQQQYQIRVYNQKQEYEQDQNDPSQQQTSESDIQDRLNNLYHKENALRRRYALLKKKEITISTNEKKLQSRIQQHQKEGKLLEEKQKNQVNNENQLNQLWQDFFKEVERIFKQIYQPQAENNVTSPQSQQAIISIQKVQTMIQGYISKTNKDKQILEKEREMVFQLRRELEAQRKEIELERTELNQMIEQSNKDIDIKSKYASLQQQ